MSKYSKLLKKYYDTEDIETSQEIKEILFEQFATDKKCCRCSSPLLKSDLKEYKYLCIECDENFYGFEI